MRKKFEFCIFASFLWVSSDGGKKFWFPGKLFSIFWNLLSQLDKHFFFPQMSNYFGFLPPQVSLKASLSIFNVGVLYLFIYWTHLSVISTWHHVHQIHFLMFFFSRFCPQRSFPFISAMVNNGTVSYDHGKDGRSSELGGCSVEIRNRDHDTYLAIRYSKGRLTVRTQKSFFFFYQAPICVLNFFILLICMF